MKFELARAVLIERQQHDFLGDSDEQSFSRDEWLRWVFSREIRFEHRKEVLHFVPVPDLSSQNLIVGRIGRQIIARENEPPEENLKDTKRPAWIASMIFIDPTYHEDGQKIAIEAQLKIGSPIAILKSLSQKLNDVRPTHKFLIEVNSIIEASDFWQFVSENEGKITKVTFDLIPPNMFGIRDDFDRELKELRDQERAQRVKFELQSSDGLALDTERVRNTVNYTVEGGGSIKARTKSRRSFNSQDRTRTLNVPEDEGVSTGSESFARKVRDWIFGQ